MGPKPGAWCDEPASLDEPSPARTLSRVSAIPSSRDPRWQAPGVTSWRLLTQDIATRSAWRVPTDTPASGHATLEPLGAGWMGVRRWCRQFCVDPQTILSIDRPLDALIIHVDCSAARQLGISMCCPPAQPTAFALRKIVTTEWLAGFGIQIPIFVVAPSRTSDAWMLISLYPDYWPRGNPAVEIECDDNIEGELIRRHFARNYQGRAKKRSERYRDSVNHIAIMRATLRARYPESAILLDALSSLVVDETD
jgi:hypothetical protein